MFQRILVPLDGSARAEQAIPVAIRLARSSGGSIVFVSIVLPPSEIGDYGAEGEIRPIEPGAYEKRLTRAEEYLRHVTEKYASELTGVSVEQEVETGSAASTIFSVARLERIDLIVMCSHGAHALFHWVFRSIAREAVHRSPVPILVLKEKENTFLRLNQDQPLRMLVPLDGSPLAETALQPALQLLAALTTAGRGELHLVQVVDMPSVAGKPILRAYELKREQDQAVQQARDYLAKIASRLFGSLPADSSIAVTRSIMVSNHVSRTIIEMTEYSEKKEQEDRYDLIAMATHGRTGFQLLRLGSVTEQVLGATALPLLVVRPQQQTMQQEHKTEREMIEK